MMESEIKRWWVAGVMCGSVLAAMAQTTLPGAPLVSQDRPPLPQVAKPYTEFFRQLLTVTPAEQEQLLAAKPPAARQVLQRKLEEYKSLPAAERELRLRALDLRWYLTQLIALSPERRQEVLPQVPEEDRTLLEERLRQWDGLSPKLQRALRENEVAIRILCNPASQGLNLPSAHPPSLPSAPGEPSSTDEAMTRWKALPAERRQQIYNHFSSILELGEKERQETLRRMNNVERAQWLATVRAIAGLPKTERERCLQGFRQFATLSREQRDQFLRNVALWNQMSAGDQQVWRNLASQLPPPPPLPPSRQRPRTPPLPPTSSSPVVKTTFSNKE